MRKAKKISRSGGWFDSESLVIPPSIPKWLPIPHFKSEEVPQEHINWVASRAAEHAQSADRDCEIGGWFLLDEVIETTNTSQTPTNSFCPDYSYEKSKILALWHTHPGENTHFFSGADIAWADSFGRPIFMFHALSKVILQYDPCTGEETSFDWLPDDRGSGRKDSGQQKQQKGQQKQKSNADFDWLQEEQIRLLIERTKAENEKIRNETERLKLEAAREEILGRQALVNLATAREDFELSLELAEMRYKLTFDFGGNTQWHGKNNSNQMMNQSQQMSQLTTGNQQERTTGQTHN